TPVTRDLFKKPLPITCRPARVDHHHYISVGGKELGVPAVGPGVSPRALRAAVDEEFDGVFFGGVEVGWLDEEALDFGAVRAGEPEGFERRQAQRLKEARVRVR